MSGIAWGSGANQLGSGDTLYVAGGTYTNTLNLLGSGTADSPINSYRDAGVVHRGEFVTTAERTAQYRPILEAIHAGTMPELVSPNLIAAPRMMSGGGPANSPARQTRENPEVHHIIVDHVLPRR
ncbi:MAG TPA: hypothetical protein VFM25_10315 [Verrucomicrobiae bacterium]|nr:hypothetical protein [Verrucomicrobiae bacterium]